MGICVSKKMSDCNNDCEFCKIIQKNQKNQKNQNNRNKFIIIGNRIKCSVCNNFFEKEESLSGDTIYF